MRMKTDRKLLWPISAAAILGASTVLILRAWHRELTKKYELIPPGKDSDLRVFLHRGQVLTGSEALARMQKGTDLNLWLAGNQYFAMDSVIAEFQKLYPEVRQIGVITLPPGKIAQAILKGGWTYKGRNYPSQPDLYATVDRNHLERLAASQRMEQYQIYAHNSLELMVAQGNPKNVKGIHDLGRSDLKVILPNPIDEGIMSVFGKKVLIRHHLWDRLSSGKECKGCHGAPNVYFTEVHHREIPEALSSGRADVGLVWATENQNGVKNGLPIEAVVLPDEDSLKDEINYMVGPLSTAVHTQNAKNYLHFILGTPAQEIYKQFGFIGAKNGDQKVTALTLGRSRKNGGYRQSLK